MDLRPLESQQELDLAAGWLQQEAINKWLDVRTLAGPATAVILKAMCQRDSYVLRLYAIDANAAPIGLVGLSNLHPAFHTGMLWYALGEPAYGGQGITTKAVSAFLRYAFREQGVEAINAWAVDSNQASIRILEKNGFRCIGRQRHCHYVDGEPHDRLLYDLLASEQLVGS